MHTVELSDEELRLVHAALHSYLDDSASRRRTCSAPAKRRTPNWPGRPGARPDPELESARGGRTGLEHEGLREALALRKTTRAVGRQVELGFTAQQLLSDRASNGRGLHEAVAGESAGGVDAVADPADDRVCVRGHVVEPGPGAHDRSSGG